MTLNCQNNSTTRPLLFTYVEFGVKRPGLLPGVKCFHHQKNGGDEVDIFDVVLLWHVSVWPPLELQ